MQLIKATFLTTVFFSSLTMMGGKSENHPAA